ncbi:MAG TPA: DUF502 domain-containing protein [Malonomonas sp.]
MPLKEVFKGIKSFAKDAVIGGLTFLLPFGILIFTFTWLFNLLTGLFSPLIKLIVDNTGSELFVAEILAILFLVVGCFTIGVFIRTKAGDLIFNWLEKLLLSPVPGYSFIKDTVSPLFSGKKTAFRHVAVGRPFGNETRVIGFVTEIHADGSVTLLSPTAPNVTSGLIWLLQKDQVEFKNISPEKAMRSLIACGAGTAEVLAAPTLPHPADVAKAS